MTLNYVAFIITVGHIILTPWITPELQRCNGNSSLHLTANGKHLSCVHCEWTKIPIWKRLQGENPCVSANVDLNQVQIINLDFNLVKHVGDEEFNCLANLEKLTLNSNKLSSFSTTAFKGLESLKELSLSDNKLTSIRLESFQDLKELQRLNLANNRLSQLIGEWPISLELLDLGSNLIRIMPVLPDITESSNTMPPKWAINLWANPLYCKCRRSEHDHLSLPYRKFCRIRLNCQKQHFSKIGMVRHSRQHKASRFCPVEAWHSYIEAPACHQPSVQLRVQRVPTRPHQSYVTCVTSGVPPPALLLARKRPRQFSAFKESRDGTSSTTLVVGPFTRGIFQCKAISPVGNLISDKVEIHRK